MNNHGQVQGTAGEGVGTNNVPLRPAGIATICSEAGLVMLRVYAQDGGWFSPNQIRALAYLLQEAADIADAERKC